MTVTIGCLILISVVVLSFRRYISNSQHTWALLCLIYHEVTEKERNRDKQSLLYAPYFTYLRRNSGMSLTAAHKMNTKPLNLRPRVPSYTLLNSMTPKNWAKTFMKP